MKWSPSDSHELDPDQGDGLHGSAPPRGARRGAWGADEPTALDVRLLQLVYEWLASQATCARCGSALRLPVRVDAWPTVFGRLCWRVAVRTRCGGWRRHAHVADVGTAAGDLTLGPLR